MMEGVKSTDNVRTFVNVTIYPRYNNNNKKVYKKENII
jgi:hypothetical protein